MTYSDFKITPGIPACIELFMALKAMEAFYCQNAAVSYWIPYTK